MTTYKVITKNYKDEILRTDFVDEKDLVAFLQFFTKDHKKIANEGIYFEIKA